MSNDTPYATRSPHDPELIETEPGDGDRPFVVTDAPPAASDQGVRDDASDHEPDYVPDAPPPVPEDRLDDDGLPPEQDRLLHAETPSTGSTAADLQSDESLSTEPRPADLPPTSQSQSQTQGLDEPVHDLPPSTTPAAHAAPVPDAQPAGQDWLTLQGRFVDDPEAAVREAAELVEAAITRLRDSLATDGGDASDTERLRLAFKRYREVHQTLSGA